MRKLSFAAVVVVALVAAGYAVAHGIEGGKGANAVAGTFSATAATPSTRTGTTAGGSAVELGALGGCRPSETKPEKSEARGTISALSSSSITVAGLTCAIPADKSADVSARFKQGDVASIACAFANGQNTLTRIEKRH